MSVQSDTVLRPRRSLLVRIAACLALVLVASLFAADPAEAMQIFVKSVTGKHYTIEVEPDEPIASVRQKAATRRKYPPMRSPSSSPVRSFSTGRRLRTTAFRKTARCI